MAAAPALEIDDSWARLAARAVHGRGDCREHAARDLTRSCRDPEAFAWWWLWLGSAAPDAVLPLVAELPPGLVLPTACVPRAVDAMTAAGLRSTTWVEVRSAVLRRLDPSDPGSCDLATLVACDPGTHPDVLASALALLEAADHPSRQALLRAAEAAVGRAEHSAPDPEALLAAATLLCGLSPAPDQQQRQLAARCARLVERCAAQGRAAGAGQPRQWNSHWVGAVLACLRS